MQNTRNAGRSQAPLPPFDTPPAELNEARGFLEMLDPGAKSFTFVTFDDVELDDGKKRSDGRLVGMWHGALDDVSAELARLNRLGAGVFVTVNETDGRGRKAENVTRVRAVWADDDGGGAGGEFPEAGPPSIVVETSPGKRHTYWCVDGLTAEEHAGVMRRMVQDYGADPAAADLARVLRLPGFSHMKRASRDKGHVVRVTGGNAEIARMLGETVQPFSRDTLLRVFPPIARLAEPATPGASAPVEFDPEILKAALKRVAGAEHHDRWIAVGQALHHEGGGSPEALSLWHEWSAMAPNYDACDCDRRWASFGRRRGAQRTGATIFAWAREGGWHGELDGEDPLDALGFEELSAALGGASSAAPGAVEPAASGGPLFQSAARWIGREPAEAPFVIERLLPRGFVTLLVSAGGRGKTLLAQQMMTCVAAGTPFLGGFATVPGEALGLFAEDDEDELHRRQNAICEALGVPFDAVADKLFPASFVGADAILWTDKKGASELLKRIAAELASRPGARLLVLDGVAHLFAALEYDRGAVTRFVSALTALATRHQISVLLLHHESKSSAANDTHAASGSTAWINAVRSVLTVRLDADQPDCRTLVHLKSNRGPKAAPVKLRMQGPAFVPVGQDRREAECQTVALELLRAAIAEGKRLSPSAHARNFAAKVLAEMQGIALDFSTEEFKHALSLLAKAGAIREETYLNNRKETRYIAIVDDAGAAVADIAAADGLY